MRRPPVRAHRLVLSAATGALCAPLLATPTAGAASGGAGDWPMFHHDPRHTGVVTDSTLTTGSVARFAVRWSAQIGASVSSPATATVASLGKRLVFVGSNAKRVVALDAVTGKQVWEFRTRGTVYSSPAVTGDVVYIGSSDNRLYALDAATGKLRCSYDTGGNVSASPVVGNPDGKGAVVYVGDNGPTGENDGGTFWALSAKTCALRWRFDGWVHAGQGGSWSPPALSRDASGRLLVVFGSSSPDNGVYALDAATGELVWRFITDPRLMDHDVGAGPTISPPGTNGFRNGVVYAEGKNGYAYALDLSTGDVIWSRDVGADAAGADGTLRSTAALVGRRLYLGYGRGVESLDAVTGAKVWASTRQRATLSSPAVADTPDAVVFAGDTQGLAYALNANSGQLVWSHQTGGAVYGSPALSGGLVYLTSGDGKLYAFGSSATAARSRR